MTRLALVYLVHGTWGRGLRAGKTLLGRPQQTPIWSEPGGYFHDELAAALSAAGFRARIQPVNWSGNNSVLDRDQVAQNLAKRLDDDLLREPGCLQIVIAHSHGGNIILEAARHYRRAETDLQIVTLATPFIDLWTKMKVRNADGYTETYGRAYGQRFGISKMRRAVASLAITGLLIGAAAGIGLVRPVGELLAAPSYWPLFAFLFIEMVVTFSMTGAGALEDKLMRVPRLDTAPMPGLARCRLLVLRGTDDEAGLALTGGALQAILGSGVSRVTSALLAIAGLFFVAIALLPSGLAHAAVVSIGCALVVFLLSSLLEAIGRATAGREFLLTGGMLKISVNSAPDADGDFTVRTLAGSPSTGIVRDEKGVRQGTNIFTADYRFKHGLYAHRDCVPAIVSWLKQPAQVA